MSATELQFRTAAIGGFQKQDVLSYIESSNQIHLERLESIQRERDQLTQEMEELRRQAADAQGHTAHLEEENTRLSAELTAARQELEAMRKDFDQQKQAMEAMKIRLERAEPAAQAYEQVKDRTAGIELEAHCRAQEVQRLSEEKVLKTRTEVEQWLHKVKAGYDLLRAAMDTSINRTGQELDKAYDILTQLSGNFAAQSEHLDKLTRNCVDELTPKAPEPLPLDEG